MSSIVEWITSALGDLVSRDIIVFIISMVPILELRGGLIAAKLLGIPLLRANVLCIIGNIIPVPFILWFITPVFTWLKGTRLLKPLVVRLEDRAMSRKDRIEKYEFWGLLFFVGIPLPGTGAWTGSLIASMLNIPFRKAFPATILGILLASVIVDIFSYGLLGIFF